MIICRLDSTGEEFLTATALAKRIGCACSLITHCKNYKSDKMNHFWIGEHGITILRDNDIAKENDKKRSRQYYYDHKEKCLAQVLTWRKAHPERVKAYRKKDRIKNKEYYNNYYREYRRKKKAEQK